jgi:hypothetical protein
MNGISSIRAIRAKAGLLSGLVLRLAAFGAAAGGTDA